MQISALAKAVRSLVVVIYLRVSTADQGKRGYSLPEQRKACVEKAQSIAEAMERDSGEKVSLELFEFVDTYGGDILERPGLEQVRQFVRESRPHTFLCLDPDRFSRSTYQAIFVANEIESCGTRLEFVQHDYQHTPEGRLFFTLRVAIAEYEKAKILERTTRGKRGKMAAGGIPHNIRIFGYDFVKESELEARRNSGEKVSGQLAPNPIEAAWVHQMFRWVMDDGLGSMGIAERLNSLGVPAKNGGKWHRGVVADVLRNTTYIGKLRLNRFDFTGLGQQMQLPKERRTKKINCKVRPVSEWISVSVPPIIPSDEFEAVQQRLRDMKRRSGTRLAPARRGHMLSGVATCGLCGAPMYYVWNNKVNSYLLRCANRYPEARGMKVPPPACTSPHQKAVPVEDFVWRQVRDWLTDPELLRRDLEVQTKESKSGQSMLVDRRKALEGQLNEAKTQQSRVLYLAGKGVVHPEVAEQQLRELMSQMEALEGDLKTVEREAASANESVQSIESTMHTALELRDNVLADLDSMDLQGRQAVVRLLIKVVRIYPGGRAECVPFR